MSNLSRFSAEELANMAKAWCPHETKMDNQSNDSFSDQMNCSNADQNQNILSTSDRMIIVVNEQAQSANSTRSGGKMETEDSDAKTQSNSK